MHRRAGITIWELVALAVVGGLCLLFFAVMTWGWGLGANELTNRTVCVSNLSSINKALVLYKGENDGAFPWLFDTMTAWDTTEVGLANAREKSPFGTSEDPNNPTQRSLTVLMFMLIRMNQSPGMFRCPNDKNSEVDLETKAGEDIGTAEDGLLEGEYYWDFSKAENVSFSWQAPIWKDGRFRQGIDSVKPETVVCADMTPAATKPQWKPADVSKLTGRAIAAQNSPNHNGEKNNILTVGGYVRSQKRPDVGRGEDNIYTASGKANAGSRSATSLDIRKHASPRDTFLIGPVGRKAE